MTDFQTLLVETPSDGVLLVRLNRPEALNALNSTLLSELGGLLDKAGADDGVRVVVLTGSEKAFAAGADIKEMSDKSYAQMMTLDFFTDAARRIEQFRKPIIAAVSGYALGGGCELAMMCDFIIASETASFGVPFLKLGILPGDGGAWLMPRNIGYARAAEMLFTARVLDARTAMDWGLVSRVVAPERLMDEAMEIAGDVASRAPQALRMTKALLRQGRDATFDQILEMTASMQALAHLTDDHLEGVTAALEKRPADFTGR